MRSKPRRNFIRSCVRVISVSVGFLITGCSEEREQTPHHSPDLQISNWDSVSHTITVTVREEDGPTVLEKTTTLSADEDVEYDGIFPQPETDSITYVAKAELQGGEVETSIFAAGKGAGFHELSIYVESSGTIDMGPVVH